MLRSLRATCVLHAVSTLVLLAGVSTSLAEDGEANFADPVEMKLEGWTIKVDPALLKSENAELKSQALGALSNHLQRVTYIVLPERLAQLRRLPIWLDLENHSLKNMQYHPGRGWLVRNGQDSRLVKHVHIPRARSLVDPKMWAKHPYCVLHELAHAYHDQVLSWDHAEIKAAYESAKESGNYKDVLAHSGRKVKHYGMNNHMEYFAEASEAYFGVNDFFPFVRAELKEFDPRMFQVLEQVWGKIR